MNVKWPRAALWIAGFGLLWLNVLDDPPLATGSYLQDVTTSGATVAIITAAPVALVCTLRDANGQAVGVPSADSHARRRHAFRFDGLKPGERYSYAISTGLDGSGAIAQGVVRTAPADDRAEVRFAFLGDSGAQPWWVWLQQTPAVHLPARFGWLPCASAVSGIGAALADWNPDFVLHLGDVVYPRGLNAHYSSGYFRPFAAAMRNAPFYAVLGNHDVMDCDGLQCLANLRMPPSSPTGDARFVSFARGPVRVIGLDCNTDRVGRIFDETHPGAAFLAAELAVCTEPWIVVASHFPMRTQSRQTYDRADLLLHMLPALEQGHVSLYLSGHDHCYQRFGEPGGKDGVPLVVSGGGGKNLYEIRASDRAAKLASVHHWCSVEVVGGAFAVTAKALDGTTVDSFVLELPVGEALSSIRARNPGRAARIDALRAR